MATDLSGEEGACSLPGRRWRASRSQGRGREEGRGLSGGRGGGGHLLVARQEGNPVVDEAAAVEEVTDALGCGAWEEGLPEVDAEVTADGPLEAGRVRPGGHLHGRLGEAGGRAEGREDVAELVGRQLEGEVKAEAGGHEGGGALEAKAGGRGEVHQGDSLTQAHEAEGGGEGAAAKQQWGGQDVQEVAGAHHGHADGQAEKQLHGQEGHHRQAGPVHPPEGSACDALDKMAAAGGGKEVAQLHPNNSAHVGV
mmetsp:Transcript_9704/g.27738  ORF Transcript_9704/g.27738 Transcript_9704/m.27738 type:complete len:253 (+) Transcript_9704:69-827(+)